MRISDWSSRRVLFRSTWRNVEELFKLANFVGCTRPGYEMEAKMLADIPTERVTIVEIPALAISSTDCRKRTKRGEPVWYLVPDGVVQYKIGRASCRERVCQYV